MKCAVHTEVDATGYCRNCGKALCAQCARDVHGILYCEACLADLLTKPQATAGGPSPGLAAVLGFIPGLGAVYNGEYTKALIHVMIFVAFVGALSSDMGDPLEPMMGLLLTAFLCYMAIDAYRTAKARLLGQPPPLPVANIRTDMPVGPLILIALGVLFLLGKHLPIGHWIREFWPVIFIVIGVALLWERLRRSS
jgi:cell wall-active antibiotic response 4TMS protein YvqF/B-box zinc finger protein